VYMGNRKEKGKSIPFLYLVAFAEKVKLLIAQECNARLLNHPAHLAGAWGCLCVVNRIAATGVVTTYDNTKGVGTKAITEHELLTGLEHRFPLWARVILHK
jgi:hypothetical protein